MKRLIIAFLLAAVILPAIAEDRDITIVVRKRKPDPTPIGGGITRAPMRLPIEATFNDATGTLTVTAPEDLEGAAYVYSFTGALEASSPQLNCTLTVPQTSDIHVISLQGETWIGEAKIVY